MAGNFLKYGEAEADFGSKNAGDIPVDSHQLIALCAPRLVFISYGVPEKGDAKWLDQQGSYMATVAAQPARRLFGCEMLGVFGSRHDRDDAGRQRRTARQCARLATTRRRTHQRPQSPRVSEVGDRPIVTVDRDAGALTLTIAQNSWRTRLVFGFCGGQLTLCKAI